MGIVEKDKKALLIKYLICFGVASAMTLFVFSLKGFFGSDAKVNIQILSDGFFVSGMLFILFAGMLYVSGEGGFIAMGFLAKKVVQAFIPMGRREHETYAQYRESKLGKTKKSADSCIFFTGLFFTVIGIIFTIIWSVNYGA